MNIILPLAITLALETGIYMILKHRDMKLLLVVSLLNVVLNMSMNIALSFIEDKTFYWIVLSVSEVVTIVIESIVITLIMKFKYLKVLLFSVIANGVSLGVGLLIQPIYQTKTAVIIVCGVFLAIYFFTYGFTLFAFMSNYRNRNNDSGGNSDN